MVGRFHWVDMCLRTRQSYSVDWGLRYSRSLVGNYPNALFASSELNCFQPIRMVLTKKVIYWTSILIYYLNIFPIRILAMLFLRLCGRRTTNAHADGLELFCIL